MTLEEIQDKLSSAMQSDMEQGVAWMNDEEARFFRTHYPELNRVIGEIMEADDEVCSD